MPLQLCTTGEITALGLREGEKYVFGERDLRGCRGRIIPDETKASLNGFT